MQMTMAAPDLAIQKAAELSDDGRYRFRLDRWWGDGPRVAWIMLNPSTADAEIDDPTIRRCINFTRGWGYDGLTVVNLYPLRATDPRLLLPWERTQDALDLAEINGDFVGLALRDAPLAIAAWGVHGLGMGEYMRSRIEAGGGRLHHLGLTKDGAPRHPLYVKGDTLPLAL